MGKVWIQGQTGLPTVIFWEEVEEEMEEGEVV